MPTSREDPADHPQNPLSDTYLRSKRYLNFFAGALLLSVLTGLAPNPSDNPFPWTVERPGHWSVVLFGCVLYYWVQLKLFWDAQTAPTRSVPQHKADSQMSAIIAGTSLAVALAYYASSLPGISKLVSCASDAASNEIASIIIGYAILIVGVSLPFVVLSAYRLVFRANITEELIRKSERASRLAEMLQSSRWRLVFSPNTYSKNSSTGSKTMKFEPGGVISEGSNTNEASWRMNDEFLELLNLSGEVFSRFYYDQATGQFKHTNDPDTRSIKGQYLFEEKSGARA